MRVQPWSAAWDDPLGRSSDEPYRGRRARWRSGWEVETVAETWDWELLAGPATITEGPVWDGAGLLYTSIEDNEIRRYDPATGDIVTVYRHRCVQRSGAWSRWRALRLRRRACRRPLQRRRCEDDVGRPLRRSPSQQPQRSRARSRWAHLVTDPRYGDDHSDRELDHDSVYRITPPGGRGHGRSSA